MIANKCGDTELLAALRNTDDTQNNGGDSEITINDSAENGADNTPLEVPSETGVGVFALFSFRRIFKLIKTWKHPFAFSIRSKL